MNASGFTLVLCYKGLSNTSSFLYELIKDDKLSELFERVFNFYEKPFFRLFNFFERISLPLFELL